MSNDLQEIIEEVKKQPASPQEEEVKKSSAKTKSESKVFRKSDYPPNQVSNDHRNNDFLSLIAKALINAPFLSVVEVYVKKLNLKNRAVSSSMQEFKKEHPRIYLTLLFLDIGCKALFLLIILLVGLRGLGLLDLIIKCFS